MFFGARRSYGVSQKSRRRARPGVLPPRRRKHGGGHLAEGHAAARARGPRRNPRRGRTRERRAQRRSRSRRARGTTRQTSRRGVAETSVFGAPPRAPLRASAPRLRRRPGRRPRARRPGSPVAPSRGGRPDPHRPPRQTKRRLRVVAFFFASVRPRFRLRGPARTAIGLVETETRVRLRERQTCELARATYNISPDARVGFARRRALKLSADFFRLVANALEPRTRLPRHRPRLAQDVPRHDPILLDTRLDGLDVRCTRLARRDVLGGVAGAARDVQRARRDSVRRHAPLLDGVQRFQRAQHDGGSFLAEARVRPVEHAVQVLVLALDLLAFASRLAHQRVRCLGARDALGGLRLRRDNLPAQALELARVLALYGHQLLLRRGQRDERRRRVAVSCLFGLGVGLEERRAQRGGLVASRGAFQQTLDGANATTLVLPRNLLRSHPGLALARERALRVTQFGFQNLLLRPGVLLARLERAPRGFARRGQRLFRILQFGSQFVTLELSLQTPAVRLGHRARALGVVVLVVVRTRRVLAIVPPHRSLGDVVLELGDDALGVAERVRHLTRVVLGVGDARRGAFLRLERATLCVLRARVRGGHEPRRDFVRVRGASRSRRLRALLGGRGGGRVGLDASRKRRELRAHHHLRRLLAAHHLRGAHAAGRALHEVPRLAGARARQRRRHRSTQRETRLEECARELRKSCFVSAFTHSMTSTFLVGASSLQKEDSREI